MNHCIYFYKLFDYLFAMDATGTEITKLEQKSTPCVI